MKHKLQGKSLSLGDIKSGKVLTTEWKPKLRYAWDTGIAVGKFLEGLKEGKILGIHCKRCKRTLVPPRIFCETCFVPLDDWRELKDTGTINTFSLCYVAWDVTRLKEPQIPAVIEIDGASPGMGFMHHIGGGDDPKTIKIGMKVRAVWKPAGERTGAITDIKYFKPL